jgi:hypothetical protein
VGEYDLDALMEASFEVCETQLAIFEKLIRACYAHQLHDLAHDLEPQMTELRQSLARRREAWAKIKNLET